MKKIKLKIDSTNYKIIINELEEFRNKLISEKRDTTPIDDILLNLVDKL